MGEAVIVAPHPDDEIIGCWEILNTRKCIIIYSGMTDAKRREEVSNLRSNTNVSVQLFLNTIPQTFFNKGTTFYFPDPINEVHPLHRQAGAMGESMARSGEDVIFYSTLMNVPYIHEVKTPNEKEELLNRIYPSQKSLWEYEKKFILFEGRCKWIF
jgi:hypothetical protein